MISIQFSSQDLADIDEACDNPELHDKIRRKLLCLRMHHNEVRNGVIASVLNLSPNTVTTYLKEFRDGGISAILEDRSYRPSSNLEPFMACLECSFKALPPRDVSEAMERIRLLTGITLKETQTRTTLHRLGLSYRKTGVIPGKADPQLQFEFFKASLEPRLVEAAAGKRKVYFVDAAHLGA